ESSPYIPPRRSSGLGQRPLVDRSFLNEKNGFTAYPIKDKDIARFGDLGHGIQGIPILVQGDQVGIGRQVPVPKFMVDGLKVPAVFPGGRIQGQEGISKEVAAFPNPTIEVPG